MGHVSSHAKSAFECTYHNDVVKSLFIISVIFCW